MDQLRELLESPALNDFSSSGSPSGPSHGAASGRELFEWDFDAYVSRAGESWVDPLEFLIDDPTFGFGKPLLPLSLIDDRRHGWNRPIFQTEAQLAMIRGAARIVAQTAPMAIGALEALGNYVIAKGFTYEVADRPSLGRSGRQAPDGLAECVQDVIDEFCDVNDWIGDRERELHNRVRRDGEAFTALYPDKNGIARTRFIEPERVTEPGNATDFEDWLAVEVPLDWVFGVVTYASDIETVVGYHVLWNPEGTDFDFLPNDDLELALRLGSGLIEHIKVNTDRNVKRGLPDMWAVLTDLVGENKLRDAVALGSAMRAAVPWITQMPTGTTPQMAQNLAIANANPVTTGASAKGKMRIQKGSVFSVPKGQEYKPLPDGQEESSVAAAQYIMRAVGTRWNMPEYMISGDASNANYSSTLIAESPFVKAREADQRFFASRFRRIFRKVLAIAAHTGRFAPFGIDDVDALLALVELQIVPPTVATRDELATAQAAAVYKQLGVLSNRTIAAKAGEDYETERKHMEEDGDATQADQSVGSPQRHEGTKNSEVHIKSASASDSTEPPKV
ncbi:MAG TPA: phage portal protein [Planctomycetaceae bacterium]|nr:phage portal protein [Planctomycetaceae bacterium]